MQEVSGSPASPVSSHNLHTWEIVLKMQHLQFCEILELQIRFFKVRLSCLLVLGMQSSTDSFSPLR